MAHFAQLNDEGYVVRVIVIANEDILDENGEESEAKGRELCELFTNEGGWIQTSYNANFRGKYAGIGDYYDEELDEFV